MGKVLTKHSRVGTTSTTALTLQYYDPTAEVKILADALSFGLGAVLLQLVGEKWKPVAYASRSRESRYALIEKEALDITWACEKFKDYVLA